MFKAATLALSLAAGMALAAPASAQQCGNDASGFRDWIEAYKQKAAGRGINAATLAKLDNVNYNKTVIGLDRNQKSFKLSFEQFYARRVNNAMINRGKALLAANQGLLDRIEKRYGVPGPVIIAIWGLETGYGRLGGGKFVVLESLATLSYDCRRSAFFEQHLFGALKVIQRGDKPLHTLRGPWAGEVGQTQFMAGHYDTYAVDADGDGRRDLISSVPDVLASTANFLKGHGWQRGSGWGPGTANYGVLRDWNKASVYVQTISVMADKIAGN
jgi:lytic murein transglycosylase